MVNPHGGVPGGRTTPERAATPTRTTNGAARDSSGGSGSGSRDGAHESTTQNQAPSDPAATVSQDPSLRFPVLQRPQSPDPPSTFAADFPSPDGVSRAHGRGSAGQQPQDAVSIHIHDTPPTAFAAAAGGAAPQHSFGPGQEQEGGSKNQEQVEQAPGAGGTQGQSQAAQAGGGVSGPLTHRGNSRARQHHGEHGTAHSLLQVRELKGSRQVAEGVEEVEGFQGRRGSRPDCSNCPLLG